MHIATYHNVESLLSNGQPNISLSPLLWHPEVESRWECHESLLMCDFRIGINVFYLSLS